MNVNKLYNFLSAERICPALLIDLTDSEKDTICKAWMDDLKSNDEMEYYGTLEAAVSDCTVSPYDDTYAEEMRNALYEILQPEIDAVMEDINDDIRAA